MKQQNYCPEKSRWFIVFLLFCAVLLAFFARMNVALSSLMIFLGLGIFSLLSLAKEEKLQVKSRGMKAPD